MGHRSTLTVRAPHPDEVAEGFPGDVPAAFPPVPRGAKVFRRLVGLTLSLAVVLDAALKLAVPGLVLLMQPTGNRCGSDVRAAYDSPRRCREARPGLSSKEPKSPGATRFVPNSKSTNKSDISYSIFRMCIPISSQTFSGRHSTPFFRAAALRSLSSDAKGSLRRIASSR
jgi:hypothetical protein